METWRGWRQKRQTVRVWLEGKHAWRKSKRNTQKQTKKLPLPTSIKLKSRWFQCPKRLSLWELQATLAIGTPEWTKVMFTWRSARQSASVQTNDRASVRFYPVFICLISNRVSYSAMQRPHLNRALNAVHYLVFYLPSVPVINFQILQIRRQERG